ncbi:MAG: hypothetical protein MJZ21_02255 [archaeon]|nr:hypothetical protein [archaeon]
MTNEEALEAIRKNIKDGKNDIAGPQIMDLASKNQQDPMLMLTCASMLLTIGDNTNFPALVGDIMTHLPERENERYEVASGLISLGRLKDAGVILADMEPSDRVHRARAAVFHGTDRFEDALAALGAMQNLEEPDLVLRVQVYGSMGKHEKAINLAKEILKDSETYRARRCYISALVLAGKDKDAHKYAKEQMKEKTADGYALMAYYSWVTGNSTLAGAMSTKALKIENKHLGALETIGLSFADKGAFWEAKIAAGSINEIEPGSPAVFRILALCKDD